MPGEVEEEEEEEDEEEEEEAEEEEEEEEAEEEEAEGEAVVETFGLVCWFVGLFLLLVLEVFFALLSVEAVAATASKLLGLVGVVLLRTYVSPVSGLNT